MKLSTWRSQWLLELFAGEVAAGLVGVNKATAVLSYRKVRGVIALRLVEQQPFAGEVGADKSYFGGMCEGKRGRGAAGKVAVFGILTQAGKVHAVAPHDLKAKTLMPIIEGKVVPNSIVYTDGFKSYGVLDVSEFKHECVDHDKKLVDQQGKHINGIESFWSQAKRILRKCNSIPRHKFELFLKECEFRFNGSVAPATGLCLSNTVAPRSNSAWSNADSERKG